MGLINNIYVFVEEESMSRDIESTTHPVEKGIDITDHVKLKPQMLSLSGRIVGKKAAATLSKLTQIFRKGAKVKYVGRNIMQEGQIVSFSNSQTNEIWKGMQFEMEIQQIRAASSSYIPPKKKKLKSKKEAGTQQLDTNKKKSKRYHTVKKGESRYSISEQYKSRGCTIAYLTKNNNNTKCLKKVGDWGSLKVGAKMLVGEW